MDELSFPPDAEAVRMVREGLTFPEIRQALEAYAGREIHDDVVSAYLARAALTRCTTHRYFDTVPWRVRPEHGATEPARMLRLLARRREAFPLSPSQDLALDSWLEMLARERLVVAYTPLHDQGFLYLDETHRQGSHEDIPIRSTILDSDELIEVLGRS